MTSSSTLPTTAPCVSRSIISLIAACGFIVLYVPMFMDFAFLFWAKDEGAHTPILLAGIGYGYWRLRASFHWVPDNKDVSFAFLQFSVGWALYGLGVVQSFYQLQGLSLLPVVAGLTTLAGGRRALRKCWQLNLLLVMTIPLPASLAEAILIKLRLALTASVTDMFAWFGYPVARHGVSITIGFYELRVANACAGLRSMLSLLAIGGLYLILQPLRRPVSTIIFLSTIIPLALAANFMRVSFLVLITYYFGSSSQMLIHDLAAYVEVGVAIFLFFLARFAIERALEGRLA
jgi:exosortase